MRANRPMTCRYCGREIEHNPYLGDVNPDHVRELILPDAPSLDILHGTGREYDAFCNKEHYVRWVHDERHRLPSPPEHEETGPTRSL